MTDIQQYTRIFWGIQPPFDIIQQLQSSLSDLMSFYPAIKWSRPKNYHITIRFLADSNSVEVEELLSCHQKIMPPNIKSFEIQLTDIQSFGKSYPRVWFWQPVASPPLNQLAQHLDHVASASTKEWFARQHIFNPHLTFCRVQKVQEKEQAALAAYRKRFQSTPISFTVNHYTLFQSEGDGLERRYTPLHTFKLA